MGKLTDIIVSIRTDKESISIKTPVSVTKDGRFTTTLPKEAVDTILEYGVTLKSNRVGTPGFFESDTLGGLRKEIGDLLREAISRELIEDRLVIKYRVVTKGCYALDVDGEIIPNGLWCKEKKKPGDNLSTNWREGNTDQNATWGVTPMVSVFARVFHKRTYAYKSGKTLETLELYRPKEGRAGSVDWINSLCRIGLPGFYASAPDYTKLPEVDATEENAALFIRLFKFIFSANEILKDFSDPDYLPAFVAANRVKEIGNL